MQLKIDEGLNGKVTQDEQNQFFAAFKADQTRFKQINEEVYETLFSIVDFDHFKKSMLEVRKSY